MVSDFTDLGQTLYWILLTLSGTVLFVLFTYGSRSREGVGTMVSEPTACFCTLSGPVFWSQFFNDYSHGDLVNNADYSFYPRDAASLDGSVRTLTGKRLKTWPKRPDGFRIQGSNGVIRIRFHSFHLLAPLPLCWLQSQCLPLRATIWPSSAYPF